MGRDFKEEKLNLKHKYSRVRPFVTISLGVASKVIDNKSIYAVFIEAEDRVIYKAKTFSKNRVKYI